MKVLFYGNLADAYGREMEFDVPHGCSIADLRRRIAILDDKRARACIGDTIVPETRVIAEDEVVEFLPPVSGG